MTFIKGLIEVNNNICLSLADLGFVNALEKMSKKINDVWDTDKQAEKSEHSYFNFITAKRHWQYYLIYIFSSLITRRFYFKLIIHNTALLL